MNLCSLSFCCLVLLLSSCNYLKFEQAQPTNTGALTKFPGNWNGSYLNKNKDTVVVNGSIISFFSEDGTFNYSDTLPSKRSILKKWNEDYILNIKDVKFGFWDAFLIKTHKDGFSLLSINLANNQDSLVRVIKSICKIKTKYDSTSKDQYYMVNPNAVAFKKIVESKLFNDPVSFKKYSPKK